MDFVCGGLAASGASIFSNPFDVLKTRMQLQGELQAKGEHAVHYKNVFHGAYVVAKNEGLAGLQKGLGVAMILHGSRNFVRLGIYQTMENEGLLTDPHGRTILYKSALASAFAGAAGAFVGSPLFLIKTQLQSQAAEQIAVGHQHGHRGAIRAIRSIYQQNGVFGLWRGVNGTMLRALAGSSSQLTTFALSKDKLKEIDILQNSPLLTSLVASIFSGLVQTVCINPFDVVSTRLFNQAVDANGRGVLYSGVVDCFGKILKTEGFLGLYKGVVANYMRLAPHAMFCLLFWDILKGWKLLYFENR
ncbi:solute carrier family 25 member 35-like [Anthonomus grandis grandis]|uniref:solute carrier family 25 member 35-like n=1 Tax=Anthonomus grandis grandis TaxID=2921223 RepID=UPI0021667176|nr:solute carrier family 25 member 35-like [Anthonomus grandis grandis]XP_050310181.1 solute carrier family 25 member 35-like [Anthonomus grandis grandis]